MQRRTLTHQQAWHRGFAAGERFQGTAYYEQPDPRVVAADLVDAWQDGFNAARSEVTA